MISPDQFRSIFYEVSPKLLGYIKTMTSDATAAEDILQNVFLRFVQALQKGYEVQNINAFLYVLARNETFREYHNSQPNIHKAATSDPIFEIADHASISLHESLELEEAILSLSLEQREVLYLKIYSGLTFAEIAQCLSISINTVASRYRYAIDKLREYLCSETKEPHHEANP